MRTSKIVREASYSSSLQRDIRDQNLMHDDTSSILQSLRVERGRNKVIDTSGILARANHGKRRSLSPAKRGKRTEC